jgi:glycosyltransferase involved in cell wall biosynthesis
MSEVIALEPSHPDFIERIQSQIGHGIRWSIPDRSLSRIERLWWMYRIVRRVRPDVVFAHSVIPAFYARLATTRPVVPVLHGADDFAATELELAERWLRYRAARVVAVIPHAAAAYEKRFPNAAVQVIPNGIDVERFSESLSIRSAARDRFGFAPNDFVVVQVGRVLPVKQQHLFVDAVARARVVEPSIRPVIAGLIEDASYAERVRVNCRACGLDPGKVVRGSVEDIPSLLAASDAYVMPSKKEAHSLAMLEALVAGLPILASEIPAFSDFAEQSGVRLIPSEDVLAWSSALVEASRNRVRFKRPSTQLSIAQTASRYLDLAGQVAQ